MKHKIIVVPEGGIANRMRAIASGYFLANQTDRSLEVIWHKDSGLNADYGDIFDTNATQFKVTILSNLKYKLTFELPRKKNLFLSAFYQKRQKKFLINQLKTGKHLLMDDELKKSIIHIDNDVTIISGSSFYDAPSSYMKELFPISHEVLKRKGEILQENNPEFAIQIRRTDNWQSRNESPLPLFEKIIEREVENNNDIKIFLATDDSSVKRRLQDKFPGIFIVNPEEPSRDNSQGIIDGMAELDIMSGCRKIYGSYYSSYSEVAAMRGDCELVVVRK